MNKEYIICAANYYPDNKIHKYQPINIETGFVLTGRRHKNIHYTFTLISSFPFNEYYKELHKNRIQGFITNTNKFVNRQEAYTIAFNAKQIIVPNKSYPTNEIGLTSEDLY